MNSDSFLSKKEHEIRLQLYDLISRGLLVLHETPIKFEDGKLFQRISLRVETMQYIERLEQRLSTIKSLFKSLLSEDGVMDMVTSYTVGIELINELESYNESK